ncbi:MAG: CotH kinase family protein [Myxococcota bacterium]
MSAGPILVEVLGCVAGDATAPLRPKSAERVEVEHLGEHAGFDTGDTGEAGGVADAPPYEADAARLLFAEGEIRRIALELDDDALDEVGPDEDVHATFVLEGEGNVYDVGLHLKGSTSYQPMDAKPAFRLDFHQWDPEARFHGLKRLALQNMYQDGTMIHEHAYVWLASRLGVPAQRNGYALVEVNGEPYGLYLVTEVIDEQFVERVWPDDDGGPLYEDAHGDFTAGSEFEVQEDGEGLDVEDLVDVVGDTSGDDWLEMLRTHFDFEVLLTYWALDLVSGNPDGYVLNTNNYYVYGQPLTQRWTLIPAGTDRAFSLEDSGPRGSATRGIGGILALGCIADDRCEEELDARIREVADAWDDLGFVPAVEEMAEVVEPACEDDPRRFKDCRTYEMLDYVEGRAEEIRDQLE